MEKVLTYLCFVTLVFPNLLSAQIVKCGDTWTNGGCSQEKVEASLAEDDFEGQKKSFRERSKKQAILHDYTTERLDAQKEYGFRISAVAVQDLCQNHSTTVSECDKAVREARATLYRRIELAQKEQKQKQDEAARSEKAKEQNSVIVNNIDQRWLQQYQTNINSNGQQIGVVNIPTNERPRAVFPPVNRSGGFREPGKPGLNRR